MYFHEIINLNDLKKAFDLQEGDQINFHKLNVAFTDRIPDWDRFITTKKKGVIRSVEDLLEFCDGINSYARPSMSQFVGQSDPIRQQEFYEDNAEFMDNLVHREIERGKLTFDENGRSINTTPGLRKSDLEARNVHYIMYAYEHFVEKICDSVRYASVEGISELRRPSA